MQQYQWSCYSHSSPLVLTWTSTFRGFLPIVPTTRLRTLAICETQKDSITYNTIKKKSKEKLIYMAREADSAVVYSGYWRFCVCVPVGGWACIEGLNGGCLLGYSKLHWQPIGKIWKGQYMSCFNSTVHVTGTWVKNIEHLVESDNLHKALG